MQASSETIQYDQASVVTTCSSIDDAPTDDFQKQTPLAYSQESKKVKLSPGESPGIKAQQQVVKFAQEEHDLKVKYMKQEHELKMRIYKLKEQLALEELEQHKTQSTYSTAGNQSTYSTADHSSSEGVKANTSSGLVYQILMTLIILTLHFTKVYYFSI